MDRVYIYQGGNTPLEVEFDDDVSTVQDFSVTLWSGLDTYFENVKKQKQWSISDITVGTKKIDCPMTQTETAAFTPGDAFLEIKLIDASGTVVLFENVPCTIGRRSDKGVIFG